MKLCEHGWSVGECSYEWCPYSKRSDEALEERAAIVKWLRESEVFAPPGPVSKHLADAIERGDHVK